MLTTMKWKTNQMLQMVHSTELLDLHLATSWTEHIMQENQIAGYVTLIS